jgi:hypothetical protein
LMPKHASPSHFQDLVLVQFFYVSIFLYSWQVIHYVHFVARHSWSPSHNSWQYDLEMIVLSADTTKGSIRESSCLSNVMAHNLFCLVCDTLHPYVTYARSMHMWSHLDAYLYMYVLECTYFYASWSFSSDSVG